MSRFKEGERVRVRGDLCTPRHLWGHEAPIEDVMQLAPGTCTTSGLTCLSGAAWKPWRYSRRGWRVPAVDLGGSNLPQG